MKIITSLAVAGLLCAAAAHGASAQGAASNVSGVNTKGFYLGAALNGSSIQVDDADFGDSERQNGGGLTLHLGYNFTRMLGIFLSGTAAAVKIDDDVTGDEEDVTLAQGDIGGRLTFPTGSSVAPYVEVAFTGLNMSDEVDNQDVELRGSGGTGAVGLNWFFNRSVALDINLRYTKGEFNTIKVGSTSVSDDDGIGVNTTRLNIGVAWYPMANRR